MPTKHWIFVRDAGFIDADHPSGLFIESVDEAITLAGSVFWRRSGLETPLTTAILSQVIGVQTEELSKRVSRVAQKNNWTIAGVYSASPFTYNQEITECKKCIADEYCEDHRGFRKGYIKITY